MNFSIRFSLAILLVAFAISPAVIAQQLEIRRAAGGLLKIQAEAGLKLVIRPDMETKVPAELNSLRSFVLGDEFERTFLRFDGTPNIGSLNVAPDSKIPRNVVSVESVLIGEKRAGIQLRTARLNLLVASVELMSNQSWITTHRDQDINLLVLTFRDAAKLHTARLNLWIGLVQTQQIALNPADPKTVATAEKFYKSIGKPRVLPTGVLPMLIVPNRNLEFGDRQVVLLEDSE